MKKLKPCPFCGGKAAIRYFRRTMAVTDRSDGKPVPVPCKGYYGVGCETPDCILYMDVESTRMVLSCGSRDIAERRWNHRTKGEE